MSSYKDDIKNVATLNLSWEKLNGCNILITGATGLIGSCLVEVLMSRPGKNYNVYASGRNEERARARFKEFAEDPNYHFFKYDVMKPLEGDINFQYIIHAANNASPNFFATKPVEIIKANIDGVSNLMDYGLLHDLKERGTGTCFTNNWSQQ